MNTLSVEIKVYVAQKLFSIGIILPITELSGKWLIKTLIKHRTMKLHALNLFVFVQDWFLD